MISSMSNSSESTKVIFFALLANLGIALAKFIGAGLTRSSSLLSEAIHSLVDTVNQLLLLLGGKRASLPPDEKHPLGYGMESYFWSLIVAILLFSLGGVFSILEGMHRWSSASEPLNHPAVAIGILAVSIVLESLSFRACVKEIRRIHPHGSLWRWFRSSTSAELLVVFTEDLAALSGLVTAAIFLSASWWSLDPRWDAAGAITVGTILVGTALLLTSEIRSLMIGEAPAKDYRGTLEELTAEEIPGGRILRLIAIQQGGGRVLLAYKVHPGSEKSADSLIRAINRIEDRARELHPEILWQFVEPDFEP